MTWTYVVYLLVSFVVTSMLVQLAPDGRFPLTTIFIAIIVGAVGAWAGDQYLAASTIFTGALVGAGIASGALLLLLHQTGILVQEPEAVETPPGKE
jgi:tetrahydromethanopterin S-methyltransferase subunit E